MCNRVVARCIGSKVTSMQGGRSTSDEMKGIVKRVSMKDGKEGMKKGRVRKLVYTTPPLKVKKKCNYQGFAGEGEGDEVK